MDEIHEVSFCLADDVFNFLLDEVITELVEITKNKAQTPPSEAQPKKITTEGKG